MNFAEGIKRIYVTIVCLVLVASAIALFDDRPKGDRYDWATANALMDNLADLAKQYGGVITDEAKPDWDDQKRSEFIAAQCSHPSTEYAEKRKEICNNHNHAKTELPKDLAYHAAQSVGILALVAIGSIFFWMLMAWIGRGFIAKKTSAGSE